VSKFIFAATIQLPTESKENIPVFAFTWGVAGHAWASAQASTLQDLKNIADQVGNENNGLSIAIPVPIATKYFALKAHYDTLKIFANDKPYDPNAIFNSVLELDFSDVSVVETHPLPKPSANGSVVPVSSSQITTLQRKGILPISLAYLTPQAVKLAVAWDGVHYDN